MTTDRLTRQELTWLLTQEARSAADKLRKGVQVLASPAPAGGAPPLVAPALDALDDAMQMLAKLQKSPTQGRGRRGRIDVAALLWEVAPHTRVTIEPGSGTEVFGDEGELRRILQVLLAAAGPSGLGVEAGAPDVEIRRDGDDVRISVTLGPDSSGTPSTERSWLARMATRYGGRLELEGATESLVLPADGAANRLEVEQLRRELEAAQRQGEAYARELAAAFAQSEAPGAVAASKAPSGAPASEASEALALLAATSGAIAVQLRTLLAAIGRDVTPLRGRSGDVGAIADTIAGRLAHGSALVGELARLGACRADEPAQRADWVELVRQTVVEVEGLARGRGVSLALSTPASVDALAPPALAAMLVRALLDHAITATPRDASVRVSLERGSAGALTLTVDDGGTTVPASAHGTLVTHDVEPTSVGRPGGIGLITAGAIARHLGASLELGDAAGGGVRVTVTFA